MLLAACIAMSSPVSAGAEELTHFLTRRGDQIMDGDKPYRFISFNIPNLLVVEDAFEFTGSSPWRWPDEFEIEDALESVRQMGGQVVRTYVISVYREGSDMGQTVHVRGPGQFNEEGFKALDKVLEVARRKGIRVLIPFVDQARWMGGVPQYAAFRGKPAEAFWSDPEIIADFKKTVEHVITRKNTYTGTLYRDDPAVFGWETGNEIAATPEWTREIAAYIKEIDPNHLVVDGRSLHKVSPWQLDEPNTDVISTHHYPWGDATDFVPPIRAAHALTKGKKPYFVGEFGFVQARLLRPVIQTVADDGIPGALIWSLRFHRREGGFYWHMEVGTGANFYKAYHWPGFASGAAYEERDMLELMRRKGFEIQGREPPPLEPPAPPTLLPIEHPAAISWQGSAGAASYDVLRAAGPEGPWTVVGQDVSDADVQYRPLFHDDQAVPGQAYCYQVVARNSAGDSKPSNIVGPVTADHRTLIDECEDLARAHETEGDLAIASENARQFQEDCHRLAMAPGSSITYRLDEPLGAWRVFAFVPDGGVNLEVSASRDGTEYVPLAAQRQAYGSGRGDYGYLIPVLYQGSALLPGASHRYLRIACPAASGRSGDAASSDPSTEQPARIEVSRVEIEHGGLQAARSSAVSAPVNTTVFAGHGRWRRFSERAVDKAAALGNRRVNVVVTVLVDLTDDLRVNRYGSFQGFGRGFQAMDDAMLREFKEGVRQTFARIVAHGMDISILCHIDAGGKVHEWRNWIDFDPLEPYEGYTYDGLMLDTIMESLSETVRPETRVDLALSGEMGTSLFRYPGAYARIIERLRAHPLSKQMNLGVSLNHSGIAGEGSPMAKTGEEQIELTGDQRDQLQAVIDACDFIGMSFYRPVTLPVTADDFVDGVEHFMSEWENHGLSIPTDKPLQFSEVGLGGGYNEEGATDDPAKAVRSPWAGPANWSDNPWRHDAMRQLRRDYHRALLDFLARQPARWPVTAAFFWSTGSWDPQGMQKEAFADPEIMALIREHNQSAAGQPRTGGG